MGETTPQVSVGWGVPAGLLVIVVLEGVQTILTPT